MADWLNQRRKAIASFLAAVATAVNVYVPSYSTQTKADVAVAIAVLGLVGVHQVKNKAAAPARARR